MTRVEVTLFTDPACPWAYCANPALRVLEWRFGEGLAWRLVTIGLREDASGLIERGYDPGRAAVGWTGFRRRYGMPFSLRPKDRAAGTGRGCRAIVAARLRDPGSEWQVLRALQLANFTTSLLLDDDDRIREALQPIGRAGLVDHLDDADVAEAYERDRAEARSASGTAADVQGKTAQSDGPVRYTAPSLVFERGGARLVAGGWQPVLAYDVLLANLAPELERTPPPERVADLFGRFPDGLTTAEVAALTAHGPEYTPDLGAAERELLEAAAGGAVVGTPCGTDAVWRATTSR